MLYPAGYVPLVIPTWIQEQTQHVVLISTIPCGLFECSFLSHPADLLLTCHSEFCAQINSGHLKIWIKYMNECDCYVSAIVRGGQSAGFALQQCSDLQTKPRGHTVWTHEV